MALSPDGRMLAFIARLADGPSQLWVRQLDTVAARPLAGTEGANYLPFWSRRPLHRLRHGRRKAQ
jgi:hypothetical protein